MSVKLTGGPASAKFKLFLFLAAFAIVGATLYYTNNLVALLQAKERQIVQLYAKGVEYVANSNTESTDITFLFENIIRPIDFPMILTGPTDSVNLSDKSSIRNVQYDSLLPKKELQAYFLDEVKKMDAVHKPIEVKYIFGQDTILLTKIHYGDSELIQRLRYYPYVQIIIASVFLLIGYLGFSQIKRSEQSNIWVGMAKETAHQFGTPISSLMGWVELLKSTYRDPDKVLDITEEMQNDIERLDRITNRFSKIGSKTELKETQLGQEIQKVIDYFQRRIPQTGKKVELRISGERNAKALLNTGLFDWVIENLIKNALDAIEQDTGSITFEIKEHHNKAEIEITDTGKGIDYKHRKDIFRPGYSTKRRGWGLGLSLSKRIIEDYHKGKIWVKSSTVGQGTTFKIVLKKTN